VGQGVIGIECRSEDENIIEALKHIEHARTRRCIDAERSLARELRASCESPIAAYGEHRDGELFVRGIVATPDGKQILRASVRGSATDGRELGRELAADLRLQGAEELLEALQTGT
jgi:hydroxymethylbilane synthase